MNIGAPIESINLIQDIGIVESSDMKFSNHCSFIASKAHSCSYLLLESFISNDFKLLIKAYKVYVRPIIESFNSVWNSHLLKDIRRLEKVQKSFNRSVCKRYRIPYKDYSLRLNIFNLESRESRRTKFDLVMSYKIMHNLVDLPFSEFFTFVPFYYPARCHAQKHYSSIKCKNYTGRFLYCERIIKIWNSLFDYIVYSSTLSLFKSN
ncbi:uncharacterized protein LOC124811297 [Hydra vulgaris]|uniref:uncharacterized protein LOC124811297 n=1 Tax=Hydra vulgaris TaxID=6087 RepID=UPI001F5F4F0F|nr:uncharacterized protein LOC124811297 [Hydra vulgaris]